jgi:hypothetical protein
MTKYIEISEEAYLRIQAAMDAMDAAEKEYYHISSSKFDAFDSTKGFGSAMWFSDTPPSSENDFQGAGLDPRKSKYMYTVKLNFKNPAGWEEYDRMALDQIVQQGYDSIILDDAVVVFDESLIDILDIEEIPPQQ